MGGEGQGGQVGGSRAERKDESAWGMRRWRRGGRLQASRGTPEMETQAGLSRREGEGARGPAAASARPGCGERQRGDTSRQESCDDPGLLKPYRPPPPQSRAPGPCAALDCSGEHQGQWLETHVREPLPGRHEGERVKSFSCVRLLATPWTV